MYICIYVYMYKCIYVSMYICIYVYVYICVYVYMYICICILTYIYIYIYPIPVRTVEPWSLLHAIFKLLSASSSEVVVYAVNTTAKKAQQVPPKYNER